MAKVTLSVIKADIGGWVGHSAIHPALEESARETLVAAQESGLVIDYYVTATGDNFHVTFTHTYAERTENSHRLKGKTSLNDRHKTFDVFLCHNSEDTPLVKKIGEQLREGGVLPWLDDWELRPGFSWRQVLEEQISKTKSVAVFVGRSGVGLWQDLEIEAFLRQFAKRKCPIIPVLLPNCQQSPKLPIFLQGHQWVDFRVQDPDPIGQLIWGITGTTKR